MAARVIFERSLSVASAWASSAASNGAGRRTAIRSLPFFGSTDEGLLISLECYTQYNRMSTFLFEEFTPWYRSAVSKMELVAFKIPIALRELMAGTELVKRDGEGQFIREAIREKLLSLGYAVEDDLTFRASRKGVGGRPTHRTVQSAAIGLNAVAPSTSKPSPSKPGKLNLDDPKDIETILKTSIVAAGLNPPLRSRPSSKAALPTDSASGPAGSIPSGRGHSKGPPKRALKQPSGGESKSDSSP